MDRLEKKLRTLNDKERLAVKEVLDRLRRGDSRGINIRKLKGREDIFRVRKGNIRIIYRVEDGAIFMLSIQRRSEKIYRGI